MQKSKCALISGFLGLIYLIYLLVHFGGTILGASSESAAVGGAIATALVTPHIILVLLATIFTLIGAFINKAGFVLTGAILFCVAAAVFFLYAIFCVPMLVLGFVGYGKVKKIKAGNA